MAKQATSVGVSEGGGHSVEGATFCGRPLSLMIICSYSILDISVWVASNSFYVCQVGCSF